MDRTNKIIHIIVAFALIFLSSTNIQAKMKNVSVITMRPASDGGKYITQQQSGTLPQLSFNLGATFDYSYEPLEYTDSTGVRTGGIVDDLVTANIQAAMGFTDWWSMGFDFPVALYETFNNWNLGLGSVEKQKLYGKLGDPRVEMKFRFLDIERYHVGLALVPFVDMPLGRSQSFLGTGQWSPGGTLVFDADIKNRVFLALNVGGQYYKYDRWDITNTNAVLKSTLNLGGGINVRINDSWALLGEAWSQSVVSAIFKNQLQNPAQFLAGGRFTPQSAAKGLGVTLAGGRGITKGPGDPKWRVLLGLNFRHIHTPPPPPPVAVDAMIEEKIIITQKIHFEFGSAQIRKISYPIVDDVAFLLQRNPQITKVRVEGHTDWIGGDAANLALSEKRARSVRDYLVKKGIEPDRLVATGYGETRPIADNNSVQGRARNRRTEFTVISVGY